MPYRDCDIIIIGTGKSMGSPIKRLLSGDNMNSKRLIEFMRRLTRVGGRKVFLILDNLKVHHSEAVKDWLEKNKEKIEVFYLPSYSPD